MARIVDPTSAGFLTVESRSQPMHVGGLQLFTPPEGAGPEYVREMYESALADTDVAPLFRKRPQRGVGTAGQWTWAEDDQFDIEHHVRHSALPRPGRVRELLELCSRLHSTRMAHERPLWEAHIIEGLDDGRVGLYTKMHHALVDGVAAMRLTQSVLSTDPTQRGMPSAWARRPETDNLESEREERDASLLEIPLSAFRTAYGMAAEAAGMPAALLKTLSRSMRNENAPVALYAPRTIFNEKITGSRRFAAQDWSMERLSAVQRAASATLNDVVLAMCSGAIRSYLLELDSLPDAGLVAMVPVSLKLDKAQEASGAGGNAVGLVMAQLSTHLADPVDRLSAISSSMDDGKEAMRAMSSVQLLAMSALGIAPAVLPPLLGVHGVGRPAFNLIISNVPGPRQTMYYNGAELDGLYPLSIPIHGMALNITCTSYVDKLAFGLTGCRRTVPSLQRLLGFLDDELSALERALGVA
ncbi:wax ester/triacylglycerol synthase family O-acyltransferase [Nocardioidaceae bacterium]|nr:wax ester/triacylglycerol synthase family O-acyltransferase [Nocardioidaceae bacterium]